MNAKRLLVAIAAISVAIALASTELAIGAAQNRAGIVVRYGDHHVERMCVAFDENTISGLELLERADVPFFAERSAIGAAICKIGEQGCGKGADDCFCHYPTFWGYWTRASDDEEWTFSDIGSADREVHDGDLDGWSWGRDGKPAPSEDTFADVCGASTVAASTTSGPQAAERPNYIPFAAIVLVLIGLIVLLLRRRRVG